MLKTSVQCRSHQQDALILMKVAKICVMKSFHHVHSDFMALPHGCQQESVPTNLTTLVNLLLRDGDNTDQDCTESQSCLIIAKLVFLNCKKLPLLGKELFF